VRLGVEPYAGDGLAGRQTAPSLRGNSAAARSKGRGRPRRDYPDGASGAWASGGRLEDQAERGSEAGIGATDGDEAEADVDCAV
jgi:hypothetical protein